jgi:hypothetical protein
MLNVVALRLVSVTVDDIDLPIGVAPPKLTALGLATSGPATEEVALAPLPGNAELQPDENKLSKIAEMLRHWIHFSGLPRLFCGVLLSGELVTIIDSLKFMSRDK